MHGKEKAKLRQRGKECPAQIEGMTDMAE